MAGARGTSTHADTAVSSAADSWIQFDVSPCEQWVWLNVPVFIIHMNPQSWHESKATIIPLGNACFVQTAYTVGPVSIHTKAKGNKNGSHQKTATSCLLLEKRTQTKHWLVDLLCHQVQTWHVYALTQDTYLLLIVIYYARSCTQVMACLKLTSKSVCTFKHGDRHVKATDMS